MIPYEKMEEIKGLINHPPHYTYSKVEPIDAIEAWNLPYHLVGSDMAEINDLVFRIKDMRQDQLQQQTELAKHETIKAMAERIVDLEAMVTNKNEKIREVESVQNDLYSQCSQYRERVEELENALRVIREQTEYVTR